MRRYISVVVAISLLVAAASPALAAKSRSVTERYDKPAAGVRVGSARTGVWYYDCLEGTGCVHVPVRPGELTADIEVDDDAGTPVQVKVFAYMGEELAEFCTFSDESIPLDGVSELLIMVINGECANGQPSVVTSGDVNVTLTR